MINFAQQKNLKKILFLSIGLLLVVALNFLISCSPQTKVLKVATEPTFPPFEMKVGDRLEGFDIDLMNAIGEELGLEIEFVTLPFDSIVVALQTGQVDAAISGMTITAKRAEVVDFSRPYFQAGLAIAIREEDSQKINNLSDLKDSKIAVQIGTTGADKAREFQEAKIITFNDSPSALQELINGNVDAVINDKPTLLYAIKKGIKGFKVIEIPVTETEEEYYGIALSKNSPNTKLINQALEQLIENETYAKIYKKWFVETPPLLPAIAPVLGEKQVSFSWLNISRILIIKGIPLTLFLTITTFCIGLIGGTFVGIALISQSNYFRLISRIYVEFFRGTPMLVQLYIIYFGLPSLFNSLPIDFQINKLVAAVIALSLNVTAYIAEIFRGGIESIDQGQFEASKSLGMNSQDTMRYVILPQALRRMLPPLGNEFITLIKDSSLAAVIGLEELFRQAQLIVADSYKAFEVYLFVAFIYLLLTILSSLTFKWLEKKMNPIK
ncbi:MAG: ABC transporter permease subunit [Xenococcus sp. (in: cyanobacteria)]